VRFGVLEVVLPVDKQKTLLTILDRGSSALKSAGVVIQKLSRSEALQQLQFLQWDEESFSCNELGKSFIFVCHSAS
jgi:hypothetical protein